MNFIKTNLNDAYIIEPKSFLDPRGCFFETYNQSAFGKNGLRVLYFYKKYQLAQLGEYF
ncbi:MAG: dTDP-4-dehydrorhamnose 3,5-epimerase family protein [Bacilli bacterium]